MYQHRTLRRRIGPIGRAFLFFVFVILVTALGVVCACETAVRYPDGFALGNALFDGKQQALYAFEVLAFAALYGFALRRNWRRTARISVGMLGVAMAFLSIAFYGFWLSRPNVSLQVAGRNTAVISVSLFVALSFWSVAARRRARRKRAVSSTSDCSNGGADELYLALSVINLVEVKG